MQSIVKIMNFIGKNTLGSLLGGLILLVVFVMPFFTLAGSDKIYVDAKSTHSKMDGSHAYPYKSIADALSHADGGDELHVAAGTYKENITIPKDVEVYGAGKDKVTLVAKDDDAAAVTMKHKSVIDGFTIKGGYYGVKVKADSRASIVKCLIEKNDSDGVRIDKASVNDKYQVSLSENVIRNNERSGIYSDKRRIIIMNNEIYDNDGDGVDLADWSSSYIKSNSIKDNDGSGLKLILDGANISVTKNTIRDNGREGIEVNSYGGNGKIDIKNTKIYKNKRHGIARIQRKNVGTGNWNGFSIQSDIKYWDNKLGDLTSILRIF